MKKIFQLTNSIFENFATSTNYIIIYSKNFDFFIHSIIFKNTKMTRKTQDRTQPIYSHIRSELTVKLGKILEKIRYFQKNTFSKNEKLKIRKILLKLLLVHSKYDCKKLIKIWVCLFCSNYPLPPYIELYSTSVSSPKITR